MISLTGLSFLGEATSQAKTRLSDRLAKTYLSMCGLVPKVRSLEERRPPSTSTLAQCGTSRDGLNTNYIQLCADQRGLVHLDCYTIVIVSRKSCSSSYVTI